MAKQEIDIGIQGNDGTGDSIRDSFRKVNENFAELYSIFGAGGTIGFTALSDAPSSYANDQVFITGYKTVNNVTSLGILAKTLTAVGGVSIDNSRPDELRLVGTTSNLYNDPAPRLGGPMNIGSIAIGNVPDPSPALVAAFNSAFSSLGISTTIDKLVISKGYADRNYVQKGVGNVVAGALRVRDEPLTPDLTDPTYDATLNGNYLSNETLPRKSIVFRGGDTMTGKLYLSDHPGLLSGQGTPNGADDLQAATKYYVDSESYSSPTNLYVSTSGDDTQLNTPPGKEGRWWSHAYRTVGAAALQAENLINLASQEPGPYRQKISYTISPNQFSSTIQSVDLSGGNSNNQGYKDAASLLQANRTFIQAETIAYINNKYVNVFTYDQAKCQRDVQIILDAISLDLVIGSNYNSLQAATTYFEKQSSAVVNSQLVQTIDAINYARQQIIDFSYNNLNLQAYLGKVIDALNYDMAFGSNYQSVLAARYFPYSETGLSIEEIVGTLNELRLTLTSLAVIAGNPVDVAVNSIDDNIDSMIIIVQGGLEPALVMPALASTSVAKQSARTLLLNNINFIQAEIVAWLAANFPKLSYSQVTCKRDVGYIVEAVAYDQIYGGNSKTLNAGQRYWKNSARQIASSELAATKGAMAYIGTLAEAIVNNVAPAQVYQNSVIQYQNQTYTGGGQRVATIANLITLVAGNTFDIQATSALGNNITTTSTANLTSGMPIVFDLAESITVTGFQSKTGSGPYLVTLVIPQQLSAPTVNTSWTIAGNSNSSYNGVRNVYASTTTSVTLSYPTDPGSFGGGTTTITPYIGNIVAGSTYYVTDIVDQTKFKISTSNGGNALTLGNAVCDTSATYSGLVVANVSPVQTNPTLGNAPATLQTIWGTINSTKPTTIAGLELFVNNNYPYINNPLAIGIITNLFQIMIDTLNLSLSNRPLPLIPAPSSAQTAQKNAAIMMMKNREFIATETIGWLRQNASPSFAYVEPDGERQWEKEIQLFVEAVAYDITYGGDSASFTQAKQYWLATTTSGITTYASTIDGTEFQDKLNSLVYAQELCTKTGSLTPATALYQALLTPTTTFVSKTPQLSGKYRVVLNTPTRIIPFSPGTLVKLTGNSNTNYNQLLTVVSSTVNTVTVDYATDPGVWSIITPTNFNIWQNDDNAFGGGVNAIADINLNWGLISNIVENNPPNLSKTIPDLNDSAYAGTGYNQVRTTIIANSLAVAQATTTYLNDKYKGGFSYNESTCRRDVGYIVDALSIDLLVAGTYQSINAGKSYYKNASAKSIAIGTQYSETVDGIEYARTLALQVLNQSTASRYQSLIPQTLDATKDANRGYTATATYVSSSSTTLNVSGIVDEIKVGMTVSGTGFTAGQIVTAVDGNTITLSAASNGTPSGTLTFTITAITSFTNNYNIMLSIVTGGFGAAPTANIGSGLYTITFSNGGNGYVDQCPPGDYNILPGKILQGTGSRATANILSYAPGVQNNVDTITCQLLQPGFFTVGEELEYAESVGSLQITIHVESGIYYEDYPIRLPANVSIKGEEFRRTIIRPLDRVSQSPWRSIFFYRDAVVDGMQIGPVDESADFVPTTNILSFASSVSAGGGLYNVTFNIPTQTYLPNTSITYTIAGQNNLAFNGEFTCVSSTNNTITLRYNADPGVFDTSSVTTITPLVTASISGTSGKIIITLSSNIQASVQWLGYVFQSDVLDSNGKPGRAVIDSVSGNFMNATVMYPFTQTGTMTINYTNGFTLQVGETITQSSSNTTATGEVLSTTANTVTYKITSGVFSTINGPIVGSISGATASVNSIILGALRPTTWHLYTTKNYGRHYLTDPLDPKSTPKNNREIDLFLCGDASIVRNITGQGHGGFMMVLDPEGQIKSKSPYGQVNTSFSRSVNKQTFAGGQYVDGFAGRLNGVITNVTPDGFQVTVTGGINSGLDVRSPQTPCAFFVRGGRYQVNTVSDYTQIFDVNGNVIGGTVKLNLGAATPWLEGTGQRINIEMAGNKSMLANDFAQVNDLGYAILAANGGITEQVSTFTYYCWTAFWALNGGQIRSVGSSSAHGQYALRASGYDVTEKPDNVELAQNLMQTARIYNPTTSNPFYGTMITGGISVYIYGYDYYPTQISELEIDHSLSDKGLIRYQVNSVSHTQTYVNTGSVGSNYRYVSTTYTASGSSGTTLKVASTTGVRVGMTVTGVGFTQGQKVTNVSLDGITLTLNGAPDSALVNGQALTIGDTITVSGASLGGISSAFTGSTIGGSNFISNANSLGAIKPSSALHITGFVSKVDTGSAFNVTFNIPTQVSSPSVTSGYVIEGFLNANYNGTFDCTFATLNTITISYPTDPGTYDGTNAGYIWAPATASATFLGKTGSAPFIYVTYLIDSLVVAPQVGGKFTISGNTNADYNGTFECVASTKSTLTLRYITDPGVSGGSATKYVFRGSVITGPFIPFGTTAIATYDGNKIIISNTATGTASGSSLSSTAGNDITAYVTGTTNTALRTFTYKGNAVAGGSAEYSNLYSASSSGRGVYSCFNISMTPVIAETGTIGSISGAGTSGSPWVATVSVSSTTGVQVGNTLTADDGSTGSLYGGDPTTVVITGFVANTSITYAVIGGTTPVAGDVENVQTRSQYTSVTLGGQNVIGLTLSTSGSNGTSSTGLAAPLYDGQLVQLRVLQNFKFYEIDNVNPTRPSTAVQFTDNLGDIYRVLTYNLTEATNEALPQYQAVLSTDQSYNYYLFQADTSKIKSTDPIDPTKTLGSTPGDVRIAVTAFGPQAAIDQIQKGTYAFAFGGKVHVIDSYTPPVTTTTITGYNQLGSSGTTLVVGGTFTGDINQTAIITNVSSFTGLVVGEPVRGFGIPAGTTIISINQSANTISLSKVTTAIGTTETFIYGGAGAIESGMVVSSAGIVSGQTVITVVTDVILSAIVSDTTGTLAVTSGSYVVGQGIKITGVNSGTGSIVGYTTGTTYYIGAVNSATEIKITSSYDNAVNSTPIFDLITTIGTLDDLVFAKDPVEVILSASPNSTPSGAISFTKSSTPYITLGAEKYSIGSPTNTAINAQRSISRGQVVADYIATGTFTGNTVSGTNSILGVSTLVEVGVGTSISGAGLDSLKVVKAVSSTSPSTITLEDASAVVVGNTITFDSAGTGFGNIPLAGGLTASTTFSGQTGTSVLSASTYTGVRHKYGNGKGSGAEFTITKTGGDSTYDGTNTTITMTKAGQNYSVGQTVTVSGSQLGGSDIVHDLTFTLGTEVNQSTYYVKTVNTGTGAITIAKTLGGTALSTITTATGSLEARTDLIVTGTSSTQVFSADTALNSPLISNVAPASFANLVVGAPISATGLGAGSFIIALNNTGIQATSTITVSVPAISNQTGTTVTVTTNTVVLSGNASQSLSGTSFSFNNLSTTIKVFTNDKTSKLVAGMTLFGNGFTTGQTVVSSKASTTSPVTEIVLSGAPDSTPFGVLGFTTLGSKLGPWYETVDVVTQTDKPVVDVFYKVEGNNSAGYNKYVQAVSSTLETITFAYTTDPAATVIATYNSTGSSGTTLIVSNTTGITAGMKIRGGGVGGFFADQTVVTVGNGITNDGVTLIISGGPSGTPTGNLTFYKPYGTGTTTITPNTSGISRPMSSSVATPLRAGYLAGSEAQITTRISTCRCSAHDLLDIGTGGYNTSNYPYQIYGNPYQKAKQEYEVVEETVGRVFYVTTDQNGIFRVGRFFTVDQGTGTVTFSASIALSNLDGLGFKRGVTVSEFSTDSTMTNDASDTVPTQSAVRAYIDNRLGLQHSGASTTATALIGPGFMPLSGQLPMKGNLSMGGFNIGSLGLPLLPSDATNKLYVDAVVNSQDSLYKAQDTAKRMGASVTNNQLLVYSNIIQNNGLTYGAWTNASLDTTSDVVINFENDILTATVQGANVRATYLSGGTPSAAGTFTGTIEGNVLSVISVPNVTVVKGMLLTGGTVSAGTYVVEYKSGAGGVGTYIINNFQTATCTGGYTIPVTLNSSAGIVAGMAVTGTGFTAGQTVLGVINATVVNVSAAGSSPAGTLVFSRDGAINNGKVSATAAIEQSKLAMRLATTTTNAVPALTTVNAGSFVVGKRYRILTTGNTNWSTPSSANWVGANDGNVGTIFQAVNAGAGSGTATDMDALQATTGVSSYDSSIFEVTNGWVTFQTASSNTTGIAAGKLRYIAPNSTLANITGTINAVSVVTTEAMVANGDGIRNQDIPSTPAAGTIGSSTGAITRVGAKSYDCIPISTDGAINSIVKTTSTGAIDVKGLRLGSLPSSGNIMQVATTTLEFYTPGQIKFAQSVGNSTATTSYFYTHDFTDANALLKSKTLSTGGSTTDGTITGLWSLGTGSTLDFSNGTLKTRSITTGGDTLDCAMTGIFTLTGSSKLQATYSGDLAEYYEGDAEYEPGTVLVFGGDKEVTTTNMMNDTRVAGVVSTDAAYMMYGACPGLKNLIALAGRVPCKVVGRVKKGDLLTTSSTPGYAVKASDPKLGSIVGKALEDKDYGEAGVIQVAIGRL